MRSPQLDRRARFEAVMEAVYEPLQRYALRRCDAATADDVIADALLVVWRRLDEIPADAVLPWCYRVAGNCLANQRRSTQRALRLSARVAALEPPAAQDEPSTPDPVLHAALARLSPSDQEVLRLWAWESLTPSEIAVALDVSPNAVSIRLHRAKQHLKAALERVRVESDTEGTRDWRR